MFGVLVKLKKIFAINIGKKLCVTLGLYGRFVSAFPLHVVLHVEVTSFHDNVTCLLCSMQSAEFSKEIMLVLL